MGRSLSLIQRSYASAFSIRDACNRWPGGELRPVSDIENPIREEWKCPGVLVTNSVVLNSGVRHYTAIIQNVRLNGLSVKAYI